MSAPRAAGPAVVLARTVRDHGLAIRARLARELGDVELAADAVQGACESALTRWAGPSTVPDDPAAWLYVTARRRAIDDIRRQRTRAATMTRWWSHGAAATTRQDSAGSTPTAEPVAADPTGMDHRVTSDPLALILLCCHPALSRDSQVALTLRLVAGLTTDEIAQAFLCAPATMAQRISRAKAKTRAARIPFGVPADYTDRIDAVLTVLYLVVNEGYLARARDAVVRVDLLDEPIRLADLFRQCLVDAPPVRPDAGADVGHLVEVDGLQALARYHRARIHQRVDAVGGLRLIDVQDRSARDTVMIAEANAILARTFTPRPAGRLQLQAAIAAAHAAAERRQRSRRG